MTSVRHLALWLAAAIAMIAVSLMPSVASAHEGHRHGGASIAATDAPSGKVASAASARVATAGAARVEPRLLCGGPCCAPSGHACSSCCSAGLMPAAEFAWSAPPPNNPELSRDVPSPPGILPEKLPEPPRPIA